MTDTTVGRQGGPADVDEAVVPVRRVPSLARVRDFALVPAILAVAVVGYLVNPVFLHKDNLVLILQTMSEVGLLVLAESLILIAGRMDLSLESTFGLAPGVAAWLFLPTAANGLGLQLPGWTMVPITLAVGAAVGAVNGLLIVKYRLNGFIVTLGMLIVLRGLLTGISAGRTYFNLPSSMLWLGQTTWGTVPVSVWLCLLLFAVGMLALGYTRQGRALYAIGGNVDAARAAGINTGRVLWLTLVLGSVLAALGGLMLTGRLASVAANQGNGYIFTVFAAAVIGGISLNGGKGTMFGAFTGVLLLYMIQDVLTLGGVPPEWIGALNGAIILVALIVSRITSGQAQD